MAPLALSRRAPLITKRTAGRAAASVQPAGHWRAEDHFHVPEREKQEVLAAIVARKTEVVNGSGDGKLQHSRLAVGAAKLLTVALRS